MVQVDPIERDIEAALKPRAFIRDGECFSFVSGLETVASRIEQLLQSEPGRACGLYEAFLAGCTAKADELDDSSGYFGQFAGSIICGWIRARCAADIDRNETVVVLLAWMDDDPFASFHSLEKQMVEAFDTNGLVAFERQIRNRFEATLTAPPGPEAVPGDRPEYWRHHWGAFLRTVYLAQNDRDAYIALTGETGLSPEDCLALAKLDHASGRIEDALAWVERGAALCGEDARTWSVRRDLEKLQCDLLPALDRSAEARAIVWREFEKHPSQYTYAGLMRFVEEADRADWHARALDAAKGADLHTRIELLIAAREIGRLADLIAGTTDETLQGASHFSTEPAAKALEEGSSGVGGAAVACAGHADRRGR
ncbi:MAG: hypothetical protein M1541_11535 [Acidobacteria bacterium]|nr:hypothetical protein [Acidobacteriota bacterium]